ncbi:fimbrial protein [Caballeronia sp. LZ062]|uniref:fimbrial protein n=1 Tax=unclassified Caballeronia TaxID=2646786 RepID=UPI002858571C|nr:MULTISPECIES: fimbrial protein [unclassified Caballeronia]MDR5856700.1 fimbrial protein [Caballeronia sp. LZ050]MDR5869902.1 fimbrial protein [Caballeronia sp. LZ062]
MKKSLISAVIAGLLGVAASGAFASDGTITFNGALTASTCTINGNGTSSKDFTVTLPTVSTSTLTASGQTAGATSYNIALSACAPVTASSKAAVFYEAGTTVDPADGRLIVAAGGAKNVKLELLNQDQTQIKAGYSRDLQNSKPADISSGSATLSYEVRYYATGATSAGAANSSVVYSIDYQ